MRDEMRWSWLLPRDAGICMFAAWSASWLHLWGVKAPDCRFVGVFAYYLMLITLAACTYIHTSHA
ncbi:hypothetical protein B0I37DRAFT_363654 [Chaetomium sp. MPI-CAGE-AT-0009]|nr:hypothetical protein B0I37DRAFT_363654 [Chaetomium sp. MPI-CAGE-AT-0009]